MKRLRIKKRNRVHKTQQILTVCARIHSINNIIVIHMHILCMQQKIKQIGLTVIEKSTSLLKTNPKLQEFMKHYFI